MGIAWYLYIHTTNFVHYHPFVFGAIAVGTLALIYATEKSLKAQR